MRYADDILLGFTGPKAEAEEIKRQLAQFLQDELKLELSETKTLITHASTQCGAVPRLRDHGAARQSEADRWPTVGQRPDPLARASGRDQGQMLPVHGSGVKPADRSSVDERGGLRDHQPLRDGVPGDRPVLPTTPATSTD